jgi:hypothetical protein
MSIAVCPLPVVPSNTNRFDIGASRALNAFKMSCANTPPTTAQIGENSCAAVVESDLESVPRVGDRLSFATIKSRSRTNAINSLGNPLSSDLFVILSLISVAWIDSSSTACSGCDGNSPWCRTWNSHRAVFEHPKMGSNPERNRSGQAWQ